MKSIIVNAALSLSPLLVASPTIAQSPTPLGCDSRCVSALSRLEPGMRVDIWYDNVRVRGRFTSLVTSPGETPRLVIMSTDSSIGSASRVILADHLQSINVAVSNVPEFAVYGAAGGASVGVAMAMLDTVLGFFRALGGSDRPITTGWRAAGFVALGAGTGALAGAMVGSVSRRWDQWFARPASDDAAH